jgi:hypothetical protein
MRYYVDRKRAVAVFLLLLFLVQLFTPIFPMDTGESKREFLNMVWGANNYAADIIPKTPKNKSIMVAYQPKCTVWINDTDGGTLTVNFYENSTGSWIRRQKNSSVAANSTVQWMFVEASVRDSKYYWRVTADDTVHNTSKTFFFYTNLSSRNWYNMNWKYRMLLTIDKKKISTTAGSVLKNFPIMVNCSSAILKQKAQSNGNDIFFVLYSDNTTKLNHEIEYYANGSILAWVNVTKITSTSDTKIWMYFGNPSASNQQNKYGTWDSGYLAVYHCNGANDYKNFTDSTINKKNATKQESAPLFQRRTSGYNLGYSVYFDGTDDSIVVPQMFTTHQEFAVQAWVNLSDVVNNRYFFSQFDGTNGQICGGTTSAPSPSFVSYKNSSENTVPIKIGALEWCMASWSNTKSGNRGYGRVNSTRTATATTGMYWPSVSVNISDRMTTTGTRRAWKGYLDEIRISGVFRNDTWLDTDYNSTSPTTNFMVYSDVQYAPPTTYRIFPKNQTTNINNQPLVQFWANSSTGKSLNINIYENSTGSWIKRQTNSSAANTTICWNFTEATLNGIKYYWQTTIDDGMTNATNLSWFQTKIGVTVPTTYLITPKNQTTNINKQPKCRIWANDTGGGTLTINFYENSTGSWIKRQKNTTAANATVQWNYSQASGYSTQYYWKTTIDDGTTNISRLYYFTTKSISGSCYGSMPDAVTDSFEYNYVYGYAPDMVRLGTSEYYLIAYTAAGNDGWLNVTKVWNNNGTIDKPSIDSTEFDATNAYYMSLCHISGDVYALAYENGTKVKVRTFRAWSSNGSVSDNTIDTLGMPRLGFYTQLMHVSGNIYAVCYASKNGTPYQGYIDTIYISPAGEIGSAVNDTQCYNTTGQYWCGRMAMVDNDTLAVVYDENVTGDTFLTTYNISASGAITDIYADRWECETTSGLTPNIMKVSGNVFAVSYQAPDPNYFSVKTVGISDAGKITHSWIDALAYTHLGAFSRIFTINNGGVYGTALRSTDNDGWICTFNMSADGTLGASFIDSIEYDASDSNWWVPVEWVNQSYYYLVYTGPNSDGLSATVIIKTNNAPTTYLISPKNQTINTNRQPKCRIWANDTNGGALTINFYENSTSTWIRRQTNASVAANATMQWNFSQAVQYNTNYWWKTTVDDGTTNLSNTYIFTTKLNATIYVATNGSDTTGTGTIGNPYKTIQKGINMTSTGQTLMIRGGIYIPGRRVAIHGKNNITIRNYPGEYVLVNGTNCPTTYYVNASIELVNSVYIRITGINVNRSKLGGITLRSGCSHIQVDNCTIGNCSSFAFKSMHDSHHVILEHCLIVNNHNNWSATSELSEEAVSFSKTTNFSIRYNKIMRNHCENIDMKTACSRGTVHHNYINTSGQKAVKILVYWGGNAIYFDARGREHNISVYSNYVTGNNSAIELNNENGTGWLENITIYNNVVSMVNLTGGKHSFNGRIPIAITAQGTQTQPHRDIRIYQNTFHSGKDNTYSTMTFGSKLTRERTRRINVSNNIFIQSSNTGYYTIGVWGMNSTDGQLELNKNIFYNSGTIRISWADGDWTSSTPSKWGSNAIFSNPMLYSVATGDFHLNSTSPAIDAASAAPVAPFDLDGISRPKGTTFDIGAYEYTPTSNWWNNNWKYRKLITIDHTKINATLKNYPLMVNISSADLKNHALSTGYDICFVSYSDNSTKFNHEIEYYSNGNLLVWVNVTKLSAVTDTRMWMYYGASVSDQQNKYGTWDSNFLAVYHMNGANNYLNFTDSTINNNNATGQSNTVYYQNKSWLGYPNGIWFPYITSNESILVPRIFSSYSAFSVSTWMNPYAGAGYFYCQANPTSVSKNITEGILVRWTGSGLWGATNGFESTRSVPAPGSKWYYVTWSHGGRDAFWMNGSVDQGWGLTTPTYNSYQISNISNRPKGGATFRGQLDEMRFSKIARNSSWHRVDYSTMRDNKTTFLNVGAEEVRGDNIVIYLITPKNQTTNINKQPKCRVSANYTGGGTFAVNFYENNTGSWVKRQKNTTAANTTIQWNFSQANSLSKRFWWKVTVDNGAENDTRLYWFTTKSTAPSTYLITPKNLSTNMNVKMTCKLWANDTNGDTLTIDFYDNASGSWTHRQKNTSSANTTVQWNYSQSTLYNTKYWWRATIYDGTTNISNTYRFTTKSSGHVPTVYVIAPKNASTNITKQPKCRIWANDTGGGPLQIDWYSSTNGVSFTHRQKNTSVAANATYQWNYSQATSFGVQYWWRVTVNDSISNASYKFSFTTKSGTASPPNITTNATTNIGNTNATLNMYIKDSGTGNPNCTVWFNCTEYHKPVGGATGGNFTLKWERNHTISAAAPPVAADINDDGYMDIFVAGNDINTSSALGKIECINGKNGTVIWMKTWKIGYTDPHVTMELADLNNDGKLELIHSGDTRTYARYANNGTIMWNISTDSGWHFIVVADIDNNGYPYVYVTSHADHTLSKLYGLNGTLVKQVYHYYACYGGISAADWDNDGDIEFVVSDGSLARAYDKDLKALWNASIDCSSTCVGLIDVNHDGRLEAVASSSANTNTTVVVINTTNGNIISSDSPPNMGAHQTGVLWDLDQDGNIEYASAYYTTKVKVLDLTTHNIDWTSPLQHAGDAGTAGNGVGNDDIELMNFEMWYSANLSFHDRTYKYVKRIIVVAGYALVLDIDNDGYNEIVTQYGGRDDPWAVGNIRVYDAQSKAPILRPRGESSYYGERRLNVATYIPELNRRKSTGHTGPEEYSFTIYGLKPGTVYFSQAVASKVNGLGIVNASKLLFLTKPNAPETISKIMANNTLRMTWAKGIGANNTYIEKNIIPDWSRGSGTVVYNGTAKMCNITGSGNVYFRLWSFTRKEGLNQYSTTSALTNATFTGWWNSNWLYCKKITVDNDRLGIQTTLSNFPVLIYTASSDYTKAHPTGKDFVFVDATNTTQYNHEIERFNVSGDNTLIAWVNVTSISPSADTILYMYYGNPSCSNQQNPTGTWNSGYSGVWHMNDSSNTKRVRDSTWHNNIAFKQATNNPLQIAGKVGYAQSYGTSDVYLAIRNDTSVQMTTYDVTISVWVNNLGNLNEGSSYSMIIDAGSGATSSGYILAYDNYTGRKWLEVDISNKTSRITAQSNNLSIWNRGWQFITVRYDRDGFVYSYLNNTFQGKTSISLLNGQNLINTGGSNITIGRDQTSSSGHWYGYLDEFALSKTLRSSDWINATFNTQNRTTGLLSLGAERAYSGHIPTIYLITPKDASTNVNKQPKCRIWANDTGGGTLTINFYENSTGSWIKRQKNTTAANATIQWNFSQASSYNTKYYWKVTVDDGSSNASSSFYSFTTKTSGHIPTFYLISPKNASVNYNHQPKCRIWANDTGGGPLQIDWYNSTNGVTYNHRQKNASVAANATYQWNYSQASANSTTYFWKVTVNDGITNSTGRFYFTTKSAWWNSDWLYRKQLTINKNYIKGNLTNFPILVYTTSNDYRKAQSSGNDFAFVDFTNSFQYNHEIERFNVSGDNTLIAWVNVTSISPSADTILYMYYGNPSCSNQQNPTGTWNSGYSGVWHMNDSSKPNRVMDSTKNKNIGFKQATNNPAQSSGKIGYAQQYGVSDVYIAVGNASSMNLYTRDMTIYMWARDNATASGSFCYLIDSGCGTTAPGWQMSFYNVSADIRWYLSNKTGYRITGNSNDSLQIYRSGWKFMAARIDRDGYVYFYLNNTFVGKQSISILNGHNITNSYPNVTIGRVTTMSTHWIGPIDEVTISMTLRSQAWINATFESQNRTTGFLTIGSQTNTSTHKPVVNQQYPTNQTKIYNRQPKCRIWTNDALGGNLTVNFYENSTGSWIKRQKNTSYANNTFQWNYSQANGWQRYYWRVTVNDGTTNISRLYYFTTSNTPPTSTIGIVSPVNKSVKVTKQPTVQVWANDTQGSVLQINWYNSTNGVTYYHRQKDSNQVANTTHTWSYAQASANNTKYWWRVTIDNGVYNKSGTYHFTTAFLGKTFSPISNASMNSILDNISISDVQQYMENLTTFTNRVTETAACQNAQAYIYETLQSIGGYWVYNYSWSQSSYDSQNIIAQLNGTLPSSKGFFAVTCHYDGVSKSPPSQAADDDASACAAALAIAKAIRNYNFNYTVVFIFFSGEEQGLYGSNQYATRSFNNDTNVLGVLNADTIGYCTNSTNFHQRKLYANSGSTWLYTFINATNNYYGAKLPETLRNNGTVIWDGWATDANSFWNFGWSAVQFFEGFVNTTNHQPGNPYLHTYGDNISKVNMSYLTNCAKLMGASLLGLAEVIVPSLDLVSPINESTTLNLRPKCRVWVNGSSTMTINFYSGTKGSGASSWTRRQTNITYGTNQIVSWNYSQAASYNKRYFWKVTVYDGKVNISNVYEFKTKMNSTLTKFERYNTGGNDIYSCYSGYWKAQTFSVGRTGSNMTHKLYAVNLLIGYLDGAPGDVTVRISTTDGSAEPTSTYLATKSFPSSILSTSEADWILVNFTEPPVLTLGTKYAIIVNATGDTSNRFYWEMSNSGVELGSAKYYGGTQATSVDNGISWGLAMESDFLFEEFGMTQGITLSNPYPENNSLSVMGTPNLRITASDSFGYAMNLVWSSNSSGTWRTFAMNNSVSNGTYRQTNANFSTYNHTYWWKVVSSDGHGYWTNATYRFSTATSLTTLTGFTITGYTYNNGHKRHATDNLNISATIKNATVVYINIFTPRGNTINQSIYANHSVITNSYWCNRNFSNGRNHAQTGYGWPSVLCGNGTYQVYIYAKGAYNGAKSSTGWFRIFPNADATMDNVTSVGDISALTGASWGTSGTNRFCRQDVNGDGLVNVADLSYITGSKNWGWSYSP